MIRRWLSDVWAWLMRDPDKVEVAPADHQQIPKTAAEAAPQEVEPMSLVTVATNVFAKFQAVAALTPLLISLVQGVEATLPAGTPGATKLKAVEDAVSSVYAKEQIAQASFQDVWPLLSGVASVLVATYKATGAFAPSQPPVSSTDK